MILLLLLLLFLPPGWWRIGFVTACRWHRFGRVSPRLCWRWHRFGSLVSSRLWPTWRGSSRARIVARISIVDLLLLLLLLWMVIPRVLFVVWSLPGMIL